MPRKPVSSSVFNPADFCPSQLSELGSAEPREAHTQQGEHARILQTSLFSVSRPPLTQATIPYCKGKLKKYHSTSLLFCFTVLRISLIDRNEVLALEQTAAFWLPLHTDGAFSPGTGSRCIQGQQPTPRRENPREHKQQTLQLVVFKVDLERTSLPSFLAQRGIPAPPATQIQPAAPTRTAGACSPYTKLFQSTAYFKAAI